MTGIFPPGKFPLESSTPVVSPPEHSPMKSMHGNNVVWLCAKYAVNANLYRLESSILTLVKWATNRNNVGGEHSLGEYTRVERSGGNFTGVDLEPYLMTNTHTEKSILGSPQLECKLVLINYVSVERYEIMITIIMDLITLENKMHYWINVKRWFNTFNEFVILSFISIN